MSARHRINGPSQETGLTESEQKVMDALVLAFNTFSCADRQHPDEMRDFTDGVHRLQDILAVRIARREYPKGWPTYPGVSTESTGG